jgi:hypothetical protein
MVKIYIVGGKKGKRKRKPIRVDFSALSHGRGISIKYTLAKALGVKIEDLYEVIPVLNEGMPSRKLAL